MRLASKFKVVGCSASSAQFHHLGRTKQRRHLNNGFFVLCRETWGSLLHVGAPQILAGRPGNRSRSSRRSDAKSQPEWATAFTRSASLLTGLMTFFKSQRRIRGKLPPASRFFPYTPVSAALSRAASHTSQVRRASTVGRSAFAPLVVT